MSAQLKSWENTARLPPGQPASLAIWRHLERPGPESPNFSKTAGCQKPYKILYKMLRQTRFQASGSPGTVFEVPGLLRDAGGPPLLLVGRGGL